MLKYLNSSIYMGISKKNNKSKTITKSFEQMRVENLKKQLGKIKEKEETVVNNKTKPNTEKKTELSEKTHLLQNQNTSSNSKELDKWTTYLAYLLKQEKNNNKKNKTKTTLTVCKYEALLTQCSYLSRMAYTPAEVFCRMTKFLDLTPNAFNDYIRAIEKIMENKVSGKMINYECSYNSLWLMKQESYKSLFTVPDINPEQFTDDNINGFFLRNSDINVYIYYHHNSDSFFNNQPTIYVVFKGASSINEFIEGLKTVGTDLPLSKLGINETNQRSEVARGYVNLLNYETTVNKVKTPIIQAIYDKIKVLIEKYSNSKPKIIITGHSLGGALAVLFAFYYMKHENRPTNPVHLITLGETTVMNAFARNDFNQLLNSSTEDRIFTYDRIESTTKKGGVGVWRNMWTKLPADLNHAGYSILQDETFPFKTTGRTNEISELRALCGMINKSDGKPTTTNTENDTPTFIALFSNGNQFKDRDQLYKNKLRVFFGTKKDSQIEVIDQALPDKTLEVHRIFKLIKDEKPENNKGNEIELSEIASGQQPQAGGGLFSSISNSISKKVNRMKGTKEQIDKYKELSQRMMPNQVIYDCNTAISLATCVGSYMGVSYMPVLRLPKIKFKSAQMIWKKEPKVNYTLYKIGDRLYSINDEKNDICVQSLKNSNNKKKPNPNSPTSQKTNSTSSNPNSPTSPNINSQKSESTKSNSGSSCSIL